MKYEKSIATFLAALMSIISVAYPVLAATNLGQYPGFLLNSDGSLNALIVVGSSASSQDVIGATDLAARLAQNAAVSTNIPGTSASINGLEKNNIDISAGALTSAFPDPIRNFHYSGLLQGTITFKGSTYNSHEALELGNTYFSHDFSTSGINGTETMVVQSNQVKYQYVFDSAINCELLATANNNTCTLSNPEYTNPIDVTLMGKPFVIVGLGNNEVIMLSGSVGAATATSGVTYGSYTIYSDLGGTSGSTPFARILVKDASGNTVESHVINQGDSFDFTAENITVKVTSAKSLQDGTVVETDVVVGPISAVQKTYGVGCDVTSTGTSDTKFPGETNWCIQVGTNSQTAVNSFATSGQISAGDTLEVVYKPTTSPQYFKYTGSTVKLPLPNNYGEIGFEGWNYNTFATLTFKEIEGVSAYQLGSGTNTPAVASNLNGIEIDSNVAGTIMGPSNTGYSRAYVLFNTTFGGPTYPVLIGFYDSTNSRIAVDVSGCTTGGNNVKCADLAAGDSTNYNFTISYGGGAATADQQFLYVNVTDPGTNAAVFNAFVLGTGAIPNGVVLAWQAKTTTWSTTQPPTFRLGTSDSSEDLDVAVQSTAAGPGSPATALIGKATQDVVANSGVIVLAPASYTGGNQVAIEVPAQALKVKAYVGKMGTGATSGGTYQQTVPITQSIARLDSEITSSDEASHDLILVGGPCVNTLVASLATASGNATAMYPYTCASWPARNFGSVRVIDNAFATGHQVVVVAGTRAADTRLAANVMQQYDTLLAGQTSSAVEVTSLSASGITAVS